MSAIFRRPPDFIIGDNYCRRWWLVPRNRFFNVYLHHFLHSDDDRALHDHPWFNVSIILRGTYTEHTVGAKKVYSAGSIRFRKATTPHRVELHAGPCWTLFLTGPNVREWGFHCPNGWRHWREYVDMRDSGRIGRGCD